MKKELCRNGGPPVSFFSNAEKVAIRMKKVIKHCVSCGLLDGKRGAVSDVVKLAELIEWHAKYGRNATAEEAIDLYERIEALIYELRSRVNGLFALA